MSYPTDRKYTKEHEWITAECLPVMRTAIITASAAPVEPSYIEAFAKSMPVSSEIMV